MLAIPRDNRERMNCLTHWFPVLEQIGMRVPKTLIVHRGDCDLLKLLDGETPDGWDAFQERIEDAADQIGYPFFLRTGMTSHKHDWKDTCYVEIEHEASGSSYMRIKERVRNLVEFSAMANIAGDPLCYDFWCLRELIPTDPVLTAFNGMPVGMEVRAFVKDGKTQCVHPYWPEDVFEHEPEGERAKAAALAELPGNDSEVYDMIEYVAKHFVGHWSVDMLLDKSGNWWCTDMALGDRSWHWPTCKYA